MRRTCFLSGPSTCPGRWQGETPGEPGSNRQFRLGRSLAPPDQGGDDRPQAAVSLHIGGYTGKYSRYGTLGVATR